MVSPPQSIIHFRCRAERPYIIGLVSEGTGGPVEADASLRGAYLAALREAVRDWAERMQCPHLRVELDPADFDTRVRFGAIAGLHTLAVATRGGDITLRSDRAWFPGSKRQGKYLPDGDVSFYWVVAHELGHVFGLDHSHRRDALMYPTQCATCRWSSFEQAGANVIHAASLDPSWSLTDPKNPFFAHTPVAAIPALLSGTLPEEALAMLDPAAPENICQERPVSDTGQTLWTSPDAVRIAPPFPVPEEVAITASLRVPRWALLVRRRLAEGRLAALRRPPHGHRPPAHRPCPQPRSSAIILLIPGLPPEPEPPGAEAPRCW